MDVIAADNGWLGLKGGTEDLFAFNPSEEILTLSEEESSVCGGVWP